MGFYVYGCQVGGDMFCLYLLMDEIQPGAFGTRLNFIHQIYREIRYHSLRDLVYQHVVIKKNTVILSNGRLVCLKIHGYFSSDGCQFHGCHGLNDASSLKRPRVQAGRLREPHTMGYR